jgi:hypothetical protein
MDWLCACGLDLSASIYQAEQAVMIFRHPRLVSASVTADGTQRTQFGR